MTSSAIAMVLFIFSFSFSIALGENFDLNRRSKFDVMKLLLRNYREKRDVTVVQRAVGEPCPVIVSNPNVGADVGWGPSLFGNFYGGGNRYNPNQGGFKSFGGNFGSNGMGLRRGLGIGVPLPPHALGPGLGYDCQDPPVQQQGQSQPHNQQGSNAAMNAPMAAQQQPQGSHITVIQAQPGANWVRNPSEPNTFYNPPLSVLQG